MSFSLPAQPASRALLAFSKQAGIEVLFPYDELEKAQSPGVNDRLEPEDALNRLLHDTGFTARRNGSGKFVVTRTTSPTGSIKGKLLAPDGRPAAGVRVTIPDARLAFMTDAQGGFDFASVPPGPHQLFVASAGYQLLQLPDVKVEANRVHALAPVTLQSSEEVSRLDPYLVEGRSANLRPFDHSQTLGTPLRAAGNLDLPRSENGALPYTIYDRDQISRSGVVDLNEFLQRELLESDAATHPPGSGTSISDFINGSANLNLRGFGADETVILVNGRRVPELLITGAPPGAPDVNFIPLGLVQQIDVLPVSASSLYNGNAVGGVINIVLRPEPDTNLTEVTTTYTNALRGFDAPQSAVSLVHSRTALDGRLRLRLLASYSRTTPPTEAELRHRQSHPSVVPGDAPLYRATPNIRSADGLPLFDGGTATVTSVAPGADGSGGLAAFAGRQGMRNFALFDSPGQLSISPDSLDFPYGLSQQRRVFAGSFVYDAFPWLQLGADAAWSRTVVNRGYDVLHGDLSLTQDNPLNPFGRDVYVSLNETASALGEHYSEALIDSYTAVLGTLLRLPADWRLALDTQYARNVVRYRGLFGANPDRWQALIDRGAYNPLRDTQVHGPSAAFYDEALIYFGGKGRFVTLGDYDTIDAAVRLTNQNLSLPTGPGVVNLGADYRRNQLARYTQELRYADGSPASDPEPWSGRMLQRYSAFAEVQGPLLPKARLPRWVHALEADLAVRYVASANARESNTAPTLALKLETAGGLTFRGSVSTSSRFPTPLLSRRVFFGTGGGEGGANFQTITDPVRNERYAVQVLEDLNPVLAPEDSVTQAAGIIFKRGRTHRFRAALDFIDTRKANEIIGLGPQNVADVEAQFPERIQRAPLDPGDIHAAGRITSLVTGSINTDRRHSQNWNAALDYSWTGCAGGILDLHTRLVWYQRYDRHVFAFSPVIDELNAPDGLTSAVLKYRANVGAGWSNRTGGFGFDGHYFHSRMLPAVEWTSQGSTRIDPYWQFDAYAHANLDRWLPGKGDRYGLRLQFRVNNVFGTGFPKYASEASGSGVQPYGDWRGRVYSVSLTATF